MNESLQPGAKSAMKAKTKILQKRKKKRKNQAKKRRRVSLCLTRTTGKTLKVTLMKG